MSQLGRERRSYTYSYSIWYMLPEIGDYARNWKKLEGDKNT
ncbi:hypothetical protein VCR12J2_640197 [Vibrio coralliirubri]|nr:hypothetical protein VCR12J2_640197 [Vibrio coralliirubri]